MYLDEAQRTIKPIETQYNGYRFRSRLEARWAVFFDVAKIQYEYEPDGYVLNDGTKYLPDFYLPQYQIYVEIKPDHLEKWAEDAAETKCRHFRDTVGKAILLVYGDPATDRCGLLFAFDLCDSGGGLYEAEARFVALGAYIVLMVKGYRDDRTVFVNDEWLSNDRVITLGNLAGIYPDEARGLTDYPMERLFNPNAEKGSFDWMRRLARQARFEYGERPLQMKKRRAVDVSGRSTDQVPSLEGVQQIQAKELL